MTCKHAQIDAEERKKMEEYRRANPRKEGDGGVYLNPDLPCRECGGKLSPREDFDRWLCEPCLFGERGAVSVFREPGTCRHCNSELVKQPRVKPTYRCQACFERKIESAKKSAATGGFISAAEMLDRLAQKMGYNSHDEYELGVIREVEQCGTGCAWTKKAERIRKNRAQRIGFGASSSTPPSTAEGAQ